MSVLTTLRGRDLTGAERTLPDDLHGAPAVLLVGFAQEQQAEIDLWLAALADLDVPQLEVPVADTAQERFARSIEGGMVPGVPQPRHSLTVVVYTDRAALLRELRLPGPVPAAVALDAAGHVTHVAAGAPDDTAVAAVVTALTGTPARSTAAP